MYGKIDAFILGKFQAIGTWVETSFGISVFSLTRFFAVLCGAAAATAGLNDTSIMDRLMDGAMAMISLFMLWEAGAVERMTREGRFANPFARDPYERGNRSVQFFVVSIQALLCALLWRVRPLDVSFLSLWAYVNFKACNTLPPSERRTFWENWFRRTEDAR